MKNYRTIIKRNYNALWTILFFIVFGLILRFQHLSLIPGSISNDELDHVVNGLSIFYTAKDFQGQHYFWELYPTQTHTYTAELSALWHAGFSALPINPVLLARLPNALFGLITAGFFGIFCYQVLRSKLLALLAFVGILISPWHIYISRTAYEAPIALAWLMMSIVLFWQSLSVKKLQHKIIFLIGSVATMFTSFYTYHGYKILFPFIYTLVFFWKNTQITQFVRSPRLFLGTISPLLAICVCWLLLFSLFFVRLEAGWYGDRANEVSVLNTDELSSEVNTQRRDSLESNLKPFFTNKATILFDDTAKNIAEAFNTKLLFTSGFDQSFALGLWEHGFLYLIQAPLLVIGLVWTLRHHRRDGVFLVALALISLIPVVIHVGTSISLRSNLFIPVLILFSAAGLHSLIISLYPVKRLILTFLFLLLTVSVFKFHYFYFVRFPILTIDTAMIDQRLLSSYVLLNYNQNIPVTVLTDDPFNSLRMFALFSKSINKATVANWQVLLHDSRQDQYVFNSLTFTSDCEGIELHSTDRVVVANPMLAEGCSLNAQYATNSAVLTQDPGRQNLLSIPSPKDNGEYFRIYNDAVCQTSAVPNFISISNAQLFAAENMTAQQFCETWVKKEVL